jgi:hypothetical protein
MAMKPKAYWVTLIFGAGLVALFLGQRALAGLSPAKTLTWLGLAGVFGGTVLRGLMVASAPGKLRKVEQILLACQLGAIAALGLYWLGTDAGTKLLGISAPEAVDRWQTIILVLWPIAMALALVPLYMVELSIGKVRFDPIRMKSHLAQVARETGREELVELQKVREFATNGLTIALAASFLMVTCNVAEQRDVRKDVSYFKTSEPGSATVAMASSLNEPITVYLFFPEVSEVADEVEAYFKQLSRRSGDKLVVERTDRMIAPALTKELKVSADGTIVLKRGPQNEKINVSTDFTRARREELRELDGKVQKALMKVIRAKRVAYFSVGHGELNDPQSAGPMASNDQGVKATLIKQLMSLLNYEVKDWDGYGKPVPDDASILFVLAPSNLFGEEELAAIDAYLARGGSLLLALPPGEAFDLGPLSGRLGVSFNPTQIADDKEFRVLRGNPSDHLELVTNQFASHASVTTLNRVGVRYGVLMADSGHLVDAAFTQTGEPPKRTYVVRSMSSAFVDANGNFSREDDEKRDRYNLVAAIEDPTAKPDKPTEGQPDDGMRAMVFATGRVFTDSVLIDRRLGLNQALIVDAVKWLGGEEEFAGETVSEKDVAIEHTRSQDTTWFYGSLVGAPILVLGLGLGAVVMRRRRSQRKR